MPRPYRVEIATRPYRSTSTLVRGWWLRYQLQCNEGELAGIERERRALDEERRLALRRNLALRSALRSDLHDTAPQRKTEADQSHYQTNLSPD